MALNNFIKAIWADELEKSLQTKLVYGQPGIINRKYESALILQRGDSVRITMVGDPTVGNYTKGTAISAPEQLTDAQATLQITEQKYVNFTIDDIDKAQGNPAVMQEAMDRSAYKLGKTADSFLAALYTDIASANALGDDTTPKTVGLGGSDSNAYQLLVDLSVILDENDVPESGRWVVVPAWYYGLLLKDDRFTKSGTPQSDLVKANGSVSRDVAGLMVLKSNQVPNTSATKYKIIAGHEAGWTMAEQINSLEAYRPEGLFSDAVKGLHVYGAKLVHPSRFGLLTASKGTL